MSARSRRLDRFARRRRAVAVTEIASLRGMARAAWDRYESGGAMPGETPGEDAVGYWAKASDFAKRSAASAARPRWSCNSITKEQCAYHASGGGIRYVLCGDRPSLGYGGAAS